VSTASVSAWGIHDKTGLPGSLAQAFVIGQKDGEIGPDGQSRSQVNRVERTQTGRSEFTGPVKQRLVETNKVECPEKPSSNAN